MSNRLYRTKRMDIWRFRIGRWLVHLGIDVMPPGRTRTELTDILERRWGHKVFSAVNRQGTRL